MRIAAILMVLGILQARAVDAYSQNTRLTINFSETELVKVLDKIEDESEFFFLYNEKLLDTERKVSIAEKDQTIGVILDDLFADTDVKYSIIDRKIVLAPEYLSEVPQPQQRSVSGVITDETGNPLPGVNITVEGTTTGVISDINGKYSINLSTQSAVLVFSFMGYNTQKVTTDGSAPVNIQMITSALALGEVVVSSIGYGTQKRKDLTGAVAQVKAPIL
ncbi:MAG: carboxypeptidase-like regulatory domain-containing protein [Bacteroidales bacterium]|nr:carboxypeptidase-like regulatory domain-containing protein [Bacteroidales bacterium]